MNSKNVLYPKIRINREKDRFPAKKSNSIWWWWWLSHYIVSDSCDTMDCSLPDSSVHGIYQARLLEWIAIFFSRESSWLRHQTHVSCIAGGFCTTEPLNHWGSPTVQHIAAAAAKSLQSCPTLCDPIPGIPQARTLEWVAIKVKSESEVAQSCLTLHDPIDCSLPGSSIHGIFQARVLEWGAIAFSNNAA